MDEENQPVARENNIRPSRKVWSVKTEPIPHSMERAPNCQLGCSIPRADPGHHRAALSRRQNVHRTSGFAVEVLLLSSKGLNESKAVC
jgi:hypothetical protein